MDMENINLKVIADNRHLIFKKNVNPTAGISVDLYDLLIEPIKENKTKEIQNLRTFLEYREKGEFLQSKLRDIKKRRIEYCLKHNEESPELLASSKTLNRQLLDTIPVWTISKRTVQLMNFLDKNFLEKYTKCIEILIRMEETT